MRLWHYQTLIVNAIVLVGFVAYGVYIAWDQVERERARIAADARNLAQSVVAGSVDDVLTNSLDRIEIRLLHQVNISSVRELLVAGAEGQILVKVERPPGGPARVVFDEPAVDVSTGAIERFTADRYTYLAPIIREKLLGFVRISASLEQLKEVRHQILRDTFEVGALVILILVATQMLLLRRIGRTVEESSEFAENLTRQLGSTIEPRSHIREVRDLKHALNRVSKALARQHWELAESEARTRAQLEASLDCLIIIDEAGRVVEFNKAAEDTFGYSREHAIGRPMHELIVPHVHREAHIAGMGHYRATGEGPVLRKRLELSALRQSGEEFPVELTVVPFSASGQSYFLGAVRDITDLKRAEAEQKRIDGLLRKTLRELDARQKALDKHAIVSVTDLQGTITHANQKFSEVSGYPIDELIGRNHRIIKSGIHTPAFYEDLWSTIAAGKTWQGEIANRRKDGSIYWVTSTIVPVLDDDGLPRQYIAIRTDVTEQKRSTLALSEARSRELSVGQQIQQTLLLSKIPRQFGPISIAAYNEASTGIDGDFFEFTGRGTDGFDLIIGDVMGKGIPAALIGAGVKQELSKVLASRLMANRSAAEALEPAPVVNALHRQLFPSLYELGSFVTFALLHCDPAGQRITYVDAGHTKAILAGGAGTRLLAGDNVPLGVLEEEVYVQHQTEWQPGDLVLMYSDGLTEAMSATGELFGVERLTRMVERLRRHEVPAAVVVQAVRKQVLEFQSGAWSSDDSTCIAVHFDHTDVHGAPPTHLELAWDLGELVGLRREISRLADTAGLTEDDRDALVLAVSETATNIIRHVRRPRVDAVVHCRGECTAQGLAIAFHYLGEAFEPPDVEPDFSGTSEGGFGLYIVRHSVDEVSYGSLGDGVQRISMSKYRQDQQGRARP